MRFSRPPVPELAGRVGLVTGAALGSAVVAPWHAPYSAAKYGLRGLSDVLRHDLRRHEIGVTLVCPGGVDTGLVETVDIAGVDREKLSSFTARFRKHANTAEHVACRIADGVVNNKALVHTSLDTRLLYDLGRFTPPLQHAVLRVIHEVGGRQLERAVSR